MNTFKLALRNIKGNHVRSLIVFLCVLGVTLLFSSTALIVEGSQNSLQAGIERLGADIMVVPEGAADRVETALLIGRPTQVWMSADYLQKISGIYGVAKVSPQMYLQSLYGASCCSVSEMFLVVFDPNTDFSVTPWLQSKLGRGLAQGEVIGGSYIFVPEGQPYIKLYGCNLALAGNLEPTGTGLDQTIFMTRETAVAISQSSVTTAEQPLIIPENSVSSVMVKVQPGVDPHQVTLRLAYYLPEVAAIESPSLFGAFRQQMTGLLWGFMALLIIAWVLGTIEIALIFSVVVNERRREIAVVRALGARRSYVFRSLLYEAAMLAVFGGAAGVFLGSLGIFLFKDFLSGTLRMPFLIPSSSSLALLFAAGIALSLLTVILSAWVPSWRISKQEPAIAMRE